MVNARDILGAAREVLEIAGTEWLKDKRRSAGRSAADAAAHESSSRRRARLRTMVSRAAQIHEVDAQIELLLTLPASEADTAAPLIRRLRDIRSELAASKDKMSPPRARSSHGEDEY